MPDKDFIPITGVPVDPSRIYLYPPPRMNIFDLCKPENKRMFDLYVQAIGGHQTIDSLFILIVCDLVAEIQNFKDIPEVEFLSWFAMAAIHGSPKIQWAGATRGRQQYGYCHHGQVTFPTWHRPYVALFEVRSRWRNQKQRSVSISMCVCSRSSMQLRSELQRSTLLGTACSIGMQQKSFAPHTGTGPNTSCHLQRSSPRRLSTSFRPMERKRLWITHSSATHSIQTA